MSRNLVSVKKVRKSVKKVRTSLMKIRKAMNKLGLRCAKLRSSLVSQPVCLTLKQIRSSFFLKTKWRFSYIVNKFEVVFHF